MESNKIQLTQEGYDKLVEKLEYLKGTRRSQVAERLKAAIALGDISENSEYDDAKNEQGLLEAEIRDLQFKLAHSEVIQTATDNSGKIVLGSTATVRDVELDSVATYMIVSTIETDPENGKISNESPLGAKLIGKTAGMTIQVHAPAGVLDYEIMSVQ